MVTQHLTKTKTVPDKTVTENTAWLIVVLGPILDPTRCAINITWVAPQLLRFIMTYGNIKVLSITMKIGL